VGVATPRDLGPPGGGTIRANHFEWNPQHVRHGRVELATPRRSCHALVQTSRTRRARPPWRCAGRRTHPYIQPITLRRPRSSTRAHRRLERRMARWSPAGHAIASPAPDRIDRAIADPGPSRPCDESPVRAQRMIDRQVDAWRTPVCTGRCRSRFDGGHRRPAADDPSGGPTGRSTRSAHDAGVRYRRAAACIDAAMSGQRPDQHDGCRLPHTRTACRRQPTRDRRLATGTRARNAERRMRRVCKIGPAQHPRQRCGLVGPVR